MTITPAHWLQKVFLMVDDPHEVSVMPATGDDINVYNIKGVRKYSYRHHHTDFHHDVMKIKRAICIPVAGMIWLFDL